MSSFNIVQREKDEGLPFMGFMSTSNDVELGFLYVLFVIDFGSKYINIAKNEINFVNLFISPLWRTVIQFLPEVEFCVDNLGFIHF